MILNIRNISFLVFLSYTNLVSAQSFPLSTIERPATIDDISNFNKILIQLDLVNKVASWNVAYLAITIGIILGSGVVAYFFNIKPFQEDIKKQGEKLENLSKEIDSKFENLGSRFRNLVTHQKTQLENSIKKVEKESVLFRDGALQNIERAETKLDSFVDKAEKEFEILKNKHRNSELDFLWNMHHMWSGMNVHINALATLVEYMEKAQEYKILYLTKLWLEQILNTLNNINSYKKEQDIMKLEQRIILLLEKITDYEELKIKIKEKLLIVFV